MNNVIFLVTEHYDNGAVYKEDSLSWTNVISAFSTREKAENYISEMPVPEEEDEDENLFFEVKKGEVMYKYVNDYDGKYVRAFIRKSCYWDEIYEALSYYVKKVPFE